MLLALSVVSVVAAQAPVVVEEPELLNVATTRFVGVNVPEVEAAFYTEQFAQGLIRAGANATSPKQFENLLMMARQRALIGECDEEQINCQTEMANAVGADALAMGEIARLDRPDGTASFRISLRIIDARTSAVLTSATAVALSSNEVVDQLHASARLMAPIAARKSGKVIRGTPTIPKAAPSKSGQQLSLFSAIAGGTAMLGGGILLATAVKDSNSIKSGDPAYRTVGQARSAAFWANFRELVSYPLISGGLVLLIVGVATYDFGPGTKTSFFLTPNGGGALVQVPLP